MIEIPKYEFQVEHSPGKVWTILRFCLAQHKRVIVPLLPAFHFFFNKNLMGYVFVQSEPLKLKEFITNSYIPASVVFDPTTHIPAVMTDSKALFYKRIIEDPSNAFTVMPHPIEFYAKDKEELLCVSGPLFGLHGYVVRIHRDRRLVFRLPNGLVCAASNIQKSRFLTVAEYDSLPDNQKLSAIDL